MDGGRAGGQANLTNVMVAACVWPLDAYSAKNWRACQSRDATSNNWPLTSCGIAMQRSAGHSLPISKANAGDSVRHRLATMSQLSSLMERSGQTMSGLGTQK